MFITTITRLTVCGALLGGFGAAALGIGTGLAHADTTVGATVSVHQTARHDDDQDVVRRGTVIPIHGDDDSRPGATHPGK